MEKSNPSNNEIVGDQLTEEIPKLKQISLGEGAATYQVCGSPLCEGGAVVVSVFRPSGEEIFQIGNAVCGGEDHGLPEEYTLGVRELVVEERVGWCCNGATQSSWPVLLAPEVLAVSAATKSLRKMPDDGAPANGASDVGEAETFGSSAEVSLGEARRRAGCSDGDVVRGLCWGGER
jgi:hypothetical protein